MNKQKIFCTLLSLTLLAGTVTIPASADETDTVTVFVTANNQGTLSQTSDGSILFNLPVEVTDLNQDGSFSADEALQAAHKTYLSSDDYETSSSEYGLSVHKLWGISTFNTLFFLNDKALSVDVGTATVSEGDRLTASVNQDNTYFADWYTYFIPHEKTVAPDEAFTLSLQGFCGMAYPPEDAVPVAGISVGTWENGSFHAMEDAVTDDNGSVTLSFAEAGTYYNTPHSLSNEYPMLQTFYNKNGDVSLDFLKTKNICNQSVGSDYISFMCLNYPRKVLGYLKKLKDI